MAAGGGVSMTDILYDQMQGLSLQIKYLGENILKALPAVKETVKVQENIRSVFGSVADIVKKATFGIAGLGLAIGKFVQLANPAVFDQFALVMKDLGAVIGRALAPILQYVVIPAVRLLADTLMNLAPIGVAVAKVFESLLPAFESILDLVSEVIQAVAEVIQEAVPYFIAFGRVITDVVRFIIKGVHDLLALIGIDLGEQAGLKKGSSTGAAVRDVGHSSIEDVVKQAQRASFSLGTASQDPAKQTADAAMAMAGKVEEIYKLMNEMPERIWEFVKELPDLAWELFKQLPELITNKTRGIEERFGLPTGTSAIAMPALDPAGLASAATRAAVEVESWYDRQADKEGVFGFTSLNPF